MSGADSHVWPAVGISESSKNGTAPALGEKWCPKAGCPLSPIRFACAKGPSEQCTYSLVVHCLTFSCLMARSIRQGLVSDPTRTALLCMSFDPLYLSIGEYISQKIADDG